MNLRFYVSAEPNGSFKERVHVIARALSDGAKTFGDTLEIVHNGVYAGPADHVDVACCWGIMGNSKEIVSGYTGAGKRVLMFDKALIRRFGVERQGHYRVGMDGPSPLKYMMRTPKNFQRWESHRIRICGRRNPGEKSSIVYAGSSQKYCDFNDLGDANDYAESVFHAVREHIRKVRFVYRPKPSWPGYREIDGVRLSLSDENLMGLLQTTRVLITHGSAAAVEAVVSGVPAITLGPCVARPVSETEIEAVLDPVLPSEAARWSWACQLAWCQWSAAELQSGEAWGFLRKELEATA